MGVWIMAGERCVTFLFIFYFLFPRIPEEGKRTARFRWGARASRDGSGGVFDRVPRGLLINTENGADEQMNRRTDEWTNGRMDERRNAQSLDLGGSL